MAVSVSHAMRRHLAGPSEPPYYTNHQDTNSYTSGGLSQSMRYTETWLYGIPPAQNGLILPYPPSQPLVVLCACSGTKRSKKTSPSICKKCKGTKLPANNGTVRSNAPKHSGTVRGQISGTMRGLSQNLSSLSLLPNNRGYHTVRETGNKNRASIFDMEDLDTSDPYDLMRRSRLVSPTETRPRTKSISPRRGRTRTRSPSPLPLKQRSRSAHWSDDVTSRRSILECDVNPYELMGKNGLRDSVDALNDIDTYEDVDNKKPLQSARNYEPVNIQKARKILAPPKELSKPVKVLSPSKELPERPPRIIKSIPTNRFKSILKKTSTFSDTDSNSDSTRIPSPVIQQTVEQSRFYLPNPTTPFIQNGAGTTRKKVQFLMENGSFHKKVGEQKLNNVIASAVALPPLSTPEPALPPSTPEPKKIDEEIKVEKIEIKTVNEVVQHQDEEVKIEKDQHLEGAPKLRRSFSDRITPTTIQVNTDPQFHDTMALRRNNRHSNPESRQVLDALQRLDGITSLEETYNQRPKEPPPPPPKIESPPVAPVRKKQKRSSLDSSSGGESSLEQETEKFHPIVTSSPIVEKAYSIIKIGGDEEVEQPEEPKSTIVQVSSSVHRFQIKNELEEVDSSRKTSILITGDDCYSTVNVNDDFPVYQSSVVVNDIAESKYNSTVYISCDEDRYEAIVPNTIITVNSPDTQLSSYELTELLRDPVEAVKRNLVPHVCGKTSKIGKRGEIGTSVVAKLLKDPELGSLVEGLESEVVAKLLQESLLKLKETRTDKVEEKDSLCSDGESNVNSINSGPYEAIEDDYSGSNRSSLTEDDLASTSTRSKFYQLLADASLDDDHQYESIRLNQDPIYEEIEIPPPLPLNPPPDTLPEVELDKSLTTRSIFEGASKYDILSYLVDARERGIESYAYSFANSGSVVIECDEVIEVTPSTEENVVKTAVEVERTDSGVGSESSKSSRSRYQPPATANPCEDCNLSVDTQVTTGDVVYTPLVCRKCAKRRVERKEIITEVVETEEKYARDLQIILEEFYQPMLVAGLLNAEQLSAVFLNVEDLLENSQSFAERLRDALEIAIEQGDEDLLTVDIGRLFLDAASMLHAFESYCIRQAAAGLLLANLEKEKELLRIFLKVSQMENTVLRRMNLNSFLMVPVQRVTKYPLLLARLNKVTPSHLEEMKELLTEAQRLVEQHLGQMNASAKDVPSRLWRRLSSGRRTTSELDSVNIKLRKLAVDILEWNHEEARFALEGKLLYTQPIDSAWRRGRTIKLTPICALLVTLGRPGVGYKSPDEETLLAFPRQTGIREAALVLARDKGGRYSLLREPLYLDRCVVATDPAWQSYFEVQELMTKDTFIFKAEDDDRTINWYRHLQYHAQGMGAWRKRRNALANIMITGISGRT